jgi:DNA gyrase/topoisomerase IV subunit A
MGPGVKEAYESGSGSVLLRARITIEGDPAAGGRGAAKGRRGARRGSAAAAAAEEEAEAAAASNGTGEAGGGRQLIVVTEVPYQVNKVRGWGFRASIKIVFRRLNVYP